jgi:tocopherol O-methyltransferase
MGLHELERYYDRNTGLFLRLGQARGTPAIHRGLWSPGVHTADAAADQVNQRIAETARDRLAGPPGSVLDLGCGVGGTLFSLARAFPEADLQGITLSARQVERAQELAQQRGLAARCRFHHGDFHRLRLPQTADLIVAIEAFVHSDQPDAFLETCRAQLAPGGLLILVDDFLSRPLETLRPAERRLVERFQHGWQVPGLCTAEQLEQRLGAHGFAAVEQSDLTQWIRTDRLRDRLVALSAPVAALPGLAGRPFARNLIGGHALTRAIRKGLIHYRQCVVKEGKLGGGKLGSESI